MEPPREDPLMLLHGSWVEVAPFGAPEPEEEPGPDEEDPLEAILREAQMEPPEPRPRTDDRAAPAPKGASQEDRSPAGKREEPERPPRCGRRSLDWPSPAEPRRPPKERTGCAGAPASASASASWCRKRGLGDPQVLLLVGPSLLLSHVLALGLGICLGKRLAASSSSAI